ncbi:MAG: RNA 2',3'-cyclic phosphodiesterase [Pseudomonadota bacterium]
MSDTIRTFVAIELPDHVVASIRKVQEGLRSYGFNVKWVRPENIHLTLKFLGDIGTADTKKVGDAIAVSMKEHAPVSLTAKGIGVFPGIKNPRVIWVGITGRQNELLALQNRLENELAGIGFPREKRPFNGHLTLGRVKQKIDPRRLVEAIEEFGGFESEPFAAGEVVLFKSDLKPTGAVYTKLVSAALNLSLS